MQARDIAQLNRSFGASDSLEMAIQDQQNVIESNSESFDINQMQKITDDLVHAKFGADSVNDSQMSQTLETALEDLAVAKYLEKLEQDQNSGYILTPAEQLLMQLAEGKAGIDFDMFDVEEGDTPLIFAGAGAFIPTPATVSAMLLGLEDAHVSRHTPEPQENNEDFSADFLDELADRPVTIFNVQGPLTIQQSPGDYSLIPEQTYDITREKKIEEKEHERRQT